MNQIGVFMRDRLLECKVWDKEREEEMVEGLLGEEVGWGLEDRMEMWDEVNMVRECEGGDQSGLIWGELNKGVKMKVDCCS